MEHRRRPPNNTHERRKRARTITSVDPWSSDQEPTKEIKKFSRIQTDVSSTLAKQVISMKKVRKGNMVFSPVAIHVVLGLMAVGCGDESRDEILSYLNSKSSEEFNSLLSQLMSLLFADGSSLGGPRLSFANSMWIDRSRKLKDAFKQVVNSTYKAGIKSVDFRTKADKVVREVNAWAETETNGLIKNFVSPSAVSPLTRLIFANALYFKGQWDEKFDASKTKDDKFFLQNGKVIQAPFITSRDDQQIGAFDGFKVLRLAYKQGEDTREYSMYFYLPDAKDGLSDLAERFGSESRFIENHVPSMYVRVGDFRFPKFKISFGFKARKVLKKLGLASAVGGALTEIADPVAGEDLFVSSILQNSFVEVNEEGTEAAAVTSMMGAGGCGRWREEDKIDFVADQIFLFVIREDTTGMVLFVGQVLNPVVG